MRAVGTCAYGYDYKCSCSSMCPVNAGGQFWVPFLRSHVPCVVVDDGGGCVCVCSPFFFFFLDSHWPETHQVDHAG